MPTMRGYQCERLVKVRPRQGDCGPTFATTGPQATRLRQQYGWRTPPIVEANILSNIYGRFGAHCRRPRTPDSISCITMVGFRRWHVGRTFGVSSTISNKPTLPRWTGKLWNGSPICMRSRMRFGDDHRMNANKFVRHELVPYFIFARLVGSLAK